ncbi:hypothetical protein TNCV_2609051 [Trichonephila clavipes]|nr:hypothetical protein TNCV_2609051 [Trichonephila clavipes]
MPPVRSSHIEANEMPHGKAPDVRTSLAIALTTKQKTVRFSSVPHNCDREHPGGGSRATHLSSTATNLYERTCDFRVPPCLKGTIH